MGRSYKKTCPKCGYEFMETEGVGFMFPSFYQETVQSAKSGELGEEIRDFFKEHEDGAINAEYVSLCCDQCGNLENGVDLSMYVPNGKKTDKEEHGRWSVAFPFEGAHYVTTSDLEEYYQLYARYPHRCEKCGGEMHVVQENEKLLCPDCKEPLEITDEIMWD